MNAKYIIAAGLVAISLGLSAADNNTEMKFKQLDADNDGVVSINEATGELQLLRNWVNVDRDLDGYIEISEFSAFEESVKSMPEK